MPISHRPTLIFMLLTLLVGSIGVSTAYGQEVTAGKKKVPDAEEISVTTKDGVAIRATYLGVTSGKDAPAVILLHMFKGNRRDMMPLGLSLQEKGFAVVIPDLRGHGDSTTVSVDGVDRKFEATTMPAIQFKNMPLDLEAIKKFLVEQNNKAALNIERLGIVAAEMSVPVAAMWAYQDWLYPSLPNLKQGQDVKAMVLLSPIMSYKSMTMAPAITSANSALRTQISLMLVAGEEDESVKEARKIEQTFSRLRGKPEKPEDRTLFLVDKLKTKLVGTKLLGEANLGVEDFIAQFLEARLVNVSYPWKDRSAP
jgi:pimeloyl-ACP methyl ester carboxylesterase